MPYLIPIILLSIIAIAEGYLNYKNHKYRIAVIAIDDILRDNHYTFSEEKLKDIRRIINYYFRKYG